MRSLSILAGEYETKASEPTQLTKELRESIHDYARAIRAAVDSNLQGIEFFVDVTKANTIGLICVYTNLPENKHVRVNCYADEIIPVLSRSHV